MIVPWLTTKERTRLITVDLYRVNRFCCRMENRNDLWLPGLWFFLETLMQLSYKNYLLYLILGAVWFIGQMPIVLFLAAKRRSWLNIGETFRNLPKDAKHSAFIAKKELLHKYYLKLQQDMNSNKRY